MGGFAAKQGDGVVESDTLVELVPAGATVVPTPVPHPLWGKIGDGLSADVRIMGKLAATVDSTADNERPHTPAVAGAAFQAPPRNRSTVESGSTTVRINGRAAARGGDPARTGNEQSPAPAGKVVAAGTVRIGG